MMKIKFGTTSNNVFRAEFLSCVLICFTLIAFEHRRLLDNAHDAILHSPISNVTSFKMGIFCGIPYEDCLCSVQSNKNEHSEDCLTDDFLMGSRSFVLISYILQVCLLRDLISFNGKYARFLVNILWITSVFIFIIIANGIYQGSCFQRLVSGILGCSDILLFGGVAYDVATSTDFDRSSRNSQNSSNNQLVEEIDDDRIFWLDLL
jgi:hypothetical protein